MKYGRRVGKGKLEGNCELEVEMGRGSVKMKGRERESEL